MNTLPQPDVMYRAFVERDRSFEGLFIVGVKSTRIFCRPTCPARRPKAENIEFFPDAQAALFSGFRACLRCKPMENCGAPPNFLTDLLEQIRVSPATRIREQDLRAQGLDPSTVRRQFQKHFGMTFHAYQRAKHMGLALQAIRAGASILPVQQQHGFESASGFWDSFRKVFGETPSRSSSIRVLTAKWIETPLGAMLALADESMLHLLEFVDRRALETEIGVIRKKLKCTVVPGENDALGRLQSELSTYFFDGRTPFETPLAFHGTDFERAVWRELQRIPAGQTRSYQDIAERLGSPNAVRAVGRANGKNCLAIIVPCHRVIGADGKLTGYGGGLWRKQWLLDHEPRA